jgi:hypothetical protein
MHREFKSSVDSNFPSRVAPQAFPVQQPKNRADAIHLIENLRPTSGNLAPSEAWRRYARRQDWMSRLEKLTAMRCQRRYAALLEDTVELFGGVERLASTFVAEFDAARG